MFFPKAQTFGSSGLGSIQYYREAHAFAEAAGAEKASDRIIEAIDWRLVHPTWQTSATQDGVASCATVTVEAAPISRERELATPTVSDRLTLRERGLMIVLDDAPPVHLRAAHNLSSADAKTG